jgi:hypothetical protein
MTTQPKPPGWLVVTTGPHAGETVTLGGPTILGRTGLLAKERGATRMQALVEFLPDSWQVLDCNGIGTRWNGTELSRSAQRLRHNDVITIGTSQIVFRETDPADDDG